MNTNNNHLLFYRNYYQGVNWDKLAERGDKSHQSKFNKQLAIIRDAQLLPSLITKYLPQGSFQELPLFTTYPGLTTGIGITHESGALGEIKMGFEFDYTTGMPVIRGHSVKGALRAAFPKLYLAPGKRPDNWEDIAYLLHGLLYKYEEDQYTPEGKTAFLRNEKALKEIEQLELELFEGIGRQGERLTIYQKDTFLDASITKASTYAGTIDRYIDQDTITPHLDPLKNPTPLPFLKILPGVEITFRFCLHQQPGGRTVEEKCALFERILRRNGLGAKTNVGFGHFEKRNL
ncbi:MAG: type III-B CRISPR module RAMP protein Cmr6 [Chitinophagales bacterium]